MRDKLLPVRFAALALILNSGVVFAQADTVTKDSPRLTPNDTIRVWSSKLKFNGKRGVVSRIETDSLAFVAPAGFRKLPREYVGDLASIDRVDVLAGRKRSLSRVGVKLLLGGAIGAVGGALIGTGVGTVFYEMNKRRYPDSDWDERALYQWFGAVIFGTGGAAVGALGGAVDGARSYEAWRRVR